MVIKEYTLQVFADYFQFYIQDEQVLEDFSAMWTKEAVNRLLACTDNTIGVGTIRNMNVPVHIAFLDSEPALQDIAHYDQINECEIRVISGKLIVMGCTDYMPEAMRIDVKAGIYRVRVLYSGFDSLSEDGLEGDDKYELHIWPTDKPKGLNVIKQYYQQASA